MAEFKGLSDEDLSNFVASCRKSLAEGEASADVKARLDEAENEMVNRWKFDGRSDRVLINQYYQLQHRLETTAFGETAARLKEDCVDINRELSRRTTRENLRRQAAPNPTDIYIQKQRERFLEVAETSKTLFVWNLAPATTDDDLINFFNVYGVVTFEREGSHLGCPFGRVHFPSTVSAVEALIHLNGTILHTLPIRLDIVNQRRERERIGERDGIVIRGKGNLGRHSGGRGRGNRGRGRGNRARGRGNPGRHAGGRERGRDEGEETAADVLAEKVELRFKLDGPYVASVGSWARRHGRGRRGTGANGGVFFRGHKGWFGGAYGGESGSYYPYANLD